MHTPSYILSSPPPTNQPPPYQLMPPGAPSDPCRHHQLPRRARAAETNRPVVPHPLPQVTTLDMGLYMIPFFPPSKTHMLYHFTPLMYRFVPHTFPLMYRFVPSCAAAYWGYVLSGYIELSTSGCISALSSVEYRGY